MGDDAGSNATSLLQTAQDHAYYIGEKFAKCSIPSAEDSLAALRAAKDAYVLFAEVDNREGMADCMQTMAQVLMYNGVPTHVIERSTHPDEIFQDVMSGQYTTSKNALPPAPQPKQMKLDEVVPSSKQLDRAKFSWNNPLQGYTYTLVWQPTKDRGIGNIKQRQAYDVLGMNTGTKMGPLSALFETRCNDASERNESFVVYMTSPDASTHLGQNMMSVQNTIAAMVTSRLQKLTFVGFGETWADPSETKVRQVHMYPTVLGQLRSCRLEAPTITVGYVGGDAASWKADPAPLIENIFDTVESNESERMYKRGDSFAPLLINKPLEDPIMYVKPKKPSSFLK